MDTKVNYVVVGLFVVLLGAALMISMYWLSATGGETKYNTFIAYTNEAVSGLNIRAPVKYNGVDVGHVSDIDLREDDPQQVKLTLEIEEGTPITESTVATLMSQGITGIMYVGLEAKTARAQPLTAMAGQKYPVIKTEPSLFVRLDTTLRTVTKDLENMSGAFEKMFDKQNQQALSDSFKHIATFTKALSDNSKELSQSIKSANKILASTAKDMPVILKRTKKGLKAIELMQHDFVRTSKTLTSTLRSSQIAVDEFSQQTMPRAIHVMGSLENTLQNISQVTNEMKQNPAVLVRGKKQQRLGPGE